MRERGSIVPNREVNNTHPVLADSAVDKMNYKYKINAWASQ